VQAGTARHGRGTDEAENVPPPSLSLF
jgi:hypothetical protein